MVHNANEEQTIEERVDGCNKPKCTRQDKEYLTNPQSDFYCKPVDLYWDIDPHSFVNGVKSERGF